VTCYQGGMRRLVVILTVVLLGGLPPAARADAAAPVHLAVDDVLGERVVLGAPEQARATIVFFMSRRAQEAATAFARAVDEQLLDRPVEHVSIVDVQRFGGLLRSIATARLRTAATDARARRRARRVAAGCDSSDGVVNRWHLIGDFDGSLFGRFGVGRDPAKPLAYVVDRAGAVHGPYFDAASVTSAIAPLR
jgi:hypothetical protein